MGWEAVGWQLKARAGSPGIPGIDSYPPPSREQGCCAVGSWEPGPRAGEGPQVGEGVRRCAHPSRLSTWQLQFAWPSLTLHLPGACCGAQLRPTCGRGPPVGASGSPAHAPAGDWGPQGPRPRGCTASVQPLELVGRTGGRRRSPQGGPPLSLGLAERVSVSRKGGSGSLQNTIRMGMRGGTQTPGRCRVGGGGGGGDSAALGPPPRNFAAAGAAVATGTESFCSPMSGLPGQEGGWEAATPWWDPGHHTTQRTASPERPHGSESSLAFHQASHAKARFFKLLGPLGQVAP